MLKRLRGSEPRNKVMDYSDVRWQHAYSIFFFRCRCSTPVTLPQKDDRVKIAAAKNTPESLWRLQKALWSLSGGRRIDSVYAETTLAQGRITLNNNEKSPKVIVLGRGKWLSFI
ncbi:hypothetical protein PoB_001357700 [Plakobranchus ocellatus]|uniref:Uncharacterized protein n=1 Tax=Plakobranchus ocellatus TaxID=259542 RepID=A0AAV3YXK1_9GAST|nr:hypothetical protein PoB_001357700 [Plakobranchus ocellatus]